MQFHLMLLINTESDPTWSKTAPEQNYQYFKTDASISVAGNAGLS